MLGVQDKAHKRRIRVPHKQGVLLLFWQPTLEPAHVSVTDAGERTLRAGKRCKERMLPKEKPAVSSAPAWRHASCQPYADRGHPASATPLSLQLGLLCACPPPPSALPPHGQPAELGGARGLSQGRAAPGWSSPLGAILKGHSPTPLPCHAPVSPQTAAR